MPHQTSSPAAEFRLEVGESKIRKFQKKPQVAAVAELVWNGLDANATRVDVHLNRSEMGAVTEIVVRDNGHGMTVKHARTAFHDYGTTWKADRTQTHDEERILHGHNGEGRLYALALGDTFTWHSTATEGETLVGVRILGSLDQPTVWRVEGAAPEDEQPGTTVRIAVPENKNLRGLEAEDASANLTAKLAFYLRAYPQVRVTFDGKPLDPDEILACDPVDLALDLPDSYADDQPQPVVTFVEWSRRLSDRAMLICNADGLALYAYGQEWSDSIVSFTPYLRSARFNALSTDDLHMLPMTEEPLLAAAEKAIRAHLGMRSRQISAEVVRQLKNEGLYPYPDTPVSGAQAVERQTFDVVVTVARTALPEKGTPRRLSVDLIRSALESNPGDLHAILEKVLALGEDDRRHLKTLLDGTSLPHVIGAATTVTNRLDFINGLRKIFADKLLRSELREVDQLHPMIAKNLWLFGEDWSMASCEVGLTNVLKAHLEDMLGPDAVLEHELHKVTKPNGRDGRVDILLFRSRRDDASTERIIVELKRPTVKVGRKELKQITDYARAIVEDPQYKGVDCKWRFYLVTYEWADEIRRDIRQMGRPEGLADDQPEYEVWVKSWGELLGAAEQKLLFFQKQLNYEATDERVVQHLRETYAHYLPDSLTED
ncbi:ATP-binding protein [Mangrovactinospora gilvigrisea]|uniref:ATP-binding protein n=1 Tax=Mangrovactinospora gilvigrisea TaxID=1428644 RepID=UPI000A615A54|nr:ATP-binding protein [Mangrovactinospora gilvigrisea]